MKKAVNLAVVNKKKQAKKPKPDAHSHISGKVVNIYNYYDRQPFMRENLPAEGSCG
jgi:hypothetical protein